MNRTFVTAGIVLFVAMVLNAQPTNHYCLWNTAQSGLVPTYAWKSPVQTGWTLGKSTKFNLREVIEDHRILAVPESSNTKPYGTYYSRSGNTIPPTPTFPRIAIVTDLRTKQALAPEIERWKEDAAREGWNVEEIVLPPTAGPIASVPLVKQKIYESYRTTTNGPLTHVFLFGQVPVPYSGGFATDGAISNPDEHPEHGGAWSTDLYYADLETIPGTPSTGSWTDSSVTIVSDQIAQRIENRNVPNDGKFDQCQIPTDVEVAVGRVDFRRLPAFGAISDTSQMELELLRRYLNKNHDYRSMRSRPLMKALIDDNFGPFINKTGGETTIEAFAASGWRSFSAIVGSSNIIEGDWFAGGSRPSLDTLPVLLAYGCGGGGYEHCSGVGTTADFVTKPVNAVFTELFGSYFGDFDAEDNIMRASLASNGTVLTSAWSGRPHWFLHQLGHGETIGDCAVSSQDNAGEYMGSMVINDDAPAVVKPFRLGLRGVQNNLMGDPSLRLTSLAMSSVELTTVDGIAMVMFRHVSGANAYVIDGAPSIHGPYTQLLRIEPKLIDSTIIVHVPNIGNARIIRVRPVVYGNASFDPYNTQAEPPSNSNDVYGRGEFAVNTATSVSDLSPTSVRLRVTPTVVTSSCKLELLASRGTPCTAFIVSMLGQIVDELSITEVDGQLEGRWFPAALPPAPYLVVTPFGSQIVQLIR